MTSNTLISFKAESCGEEEWRAGQEGGPNNREGKNGRRLRGLNKHYTQRDSPGRGKGKRTNAVYPIRPSSSQSVDNRKGKLTHTKKEKRQGQVEEFLPPFLVLFFWPGKRGPAAFFGRIVDRSLTRMPKISQVDKLTPNRRGS